MFVHYLDNGLALGQFGTVTPNAQQDTDRASEWAAGNALLPHFITGSDGNLYGIYSDESHHSALHLVKVSRLNTIRQQDVVINFPSAYTPPVQSFTELSSGLPFDDSLTNNTAGWTKSPVYDNLTNIYSDYFKVSTRVSTYKRDQPGDVNVIAAASSTTVKTVSRDLGTINATNDWTVSGIIKWGGEANSTGTFQYLRVLDNTGKVLARLYTQSAGAGASTTTTVYGNGSVIATGLKTDMGSIVGTPTPFTITYNGGNITFIYGGYTPVARS